MKKNREQAKADLQAKFDEVYDKITQTKQMFVKLAVELNGKIQTFLKTNNTNILNLENKHNDQHNTFKTYANAQLATLDSDITKLDQAIEQEKLDRIRTEKENIENIQNLLINYLIILNWRNKQEQRMKRKYQIQQRIHHNQLIKQQKIKLLKRNRNIKNQQKIQIIHYNLKIDIQKDLKIIQLENFIYKLIIQDEINNRFDQQDKVVDDLRSVIRTIQNTLGILGKDV